MRPLNRRRKTDLSTAIQQDYLTGEFYMTAAYKLPVYRPEEREFGLDRAEMLVDAILTDGIIDAMLDYWLVLPPVQARSIDRSDMGVWYPSGDLGPHILVMRRVRVMRAQIAHNTIGSEWLRADWPLDPIFRGVEDYPGSPWVTYRPKYEDDDPEKKEVVKTDG